MPDYKFCGDCVHIQCNLEWFQNVIKYFDSFPSEITIERVTDKMKRTPRRCYGWPPTRNLDSTRNETDYINTYVHPHDRACGMFREKKSNAN